MDIPTQTHAAVGAASGGITEALLEARPEWKERELVDDLRVSALYAALDGQAVCLLAYDICEISRKQALELRAAVGRALDIPPASVHVYCSHTHSSSCEDGHDMPCLTATSVRAAQEARERAVEVREIGFLRVDTGCTFNINRRTLPGPLGAWCLMQSRGCVDDGDAVDGTGRVRERLRLYGAAEEDVAAVKGPFLATRPNDPYLDLVLFPRAGGGYAAGLVRFTAHAVVCSAGYWKPNLGRDYPGVLCDRLAAAFGCPILFLQGPCGDHRTRHRDVGTAERDRIAEGLAAQIAAHEGQIRTFPFDVLENECVEVRSPLVDRFPASEEDAVQRIREAEEAREALPSGPESLKRRKDLYEAIAFTNQANLARKGGVYLRPEDVSRGAAELEVSCVRFGGIRLLNFEGELFSTVTAGLENTASGPVVVTSFCDGVTGYLLEAQDYAEGGYESTWGLFAPEAVSSLRGVAQKLLDRS